MAVRAINATQVEVEFSQIPDAEDAKGNLSIVGTSTVIWLNEDPVASADGKTLTFTANANIDVEDATVTVAETLLDGSTTAKSAKYVGLMTYKDTVAPTILGVEKLTATTFKVKFSEPMKVLGPADYKLANGTAATVSSNFSAGKQDVVFTITGTAGDVVTATFLGAKDQADNIISPNPAVVTFTVGAKDGVRPEVVSLTPLGLNKLEIKFSEEVTNFSGAQITIGGTPLTVAATGLVKDKDDATKYTVTFTSPTLTAGLYTVAIAENLLVDASGETSKAFSQIVNFQGDTVAPKFVKAEIVVDATTRKEVLELTFDKDVANKNLSGLAATEVDSNLVSKTATLTAGALAQKSATNKKVLTVVLDTVKFASVDLKKDATYTVTFVKGDIKGENAVDVAAFTATFKRGADGTPVGDAPEVNSATATNPDTVTVVFNKELDGVTATNVANYSIPGLAIEKATLRAYSSGTQNVELTLAAGTNTLTGDRVLSIANVKSKTGAVMLPASKTVEGMKENVKPTVLSAKYSATSGGVVTQITITFSEPVTVSADAFKATIAKDALDETAKALTNSAVTTAANNVVLNVTGNLTTAQIEKGITIELNGTPVIKDISTNDLVFTSILASY